MFLFLFRSYLSTYWVSRDDLSFRLGKLFQDCGNNLSVTLGFDRATESTELISIFKGNENNNNIPISQIILVLAGIPGSGKSTLARNLLKIIPETSLSSRKWISLNQDVLGSRNRVIAECDAHLADGYSVIIDRCNFDFQQRSYWIALSRKYNARAACIVLPDSINTLLCAQRATARGDDGIHEPGTDWFKVCNIMTYNFSSPTLDEGFQQIIRLENSFDINDLIKEIDKIFNSEGIR